MAALTGPGHERREYTVHGPESVTLRRQVEQIGAAIGRRIGLKLIPVDAARVEMGRVMPPVVVETILRLWSAGNGAPAPVSTTVEEVTGEPARTFARWAEDHAADFR